MQSRLELHTVVAMLGIALGRGSWGRWGKPTLRTEVQILDQACTSESCYKNFGEISFQKDQPNVQRCFWRDFQVMGGNSQLKYLHRYSLPQ